MPSPRTPAAARGCRPPPPARWRRVPPPPTAACRPREPWPRCQFGHQRCQIFWRSNEILRPVAFVDLLELAWIQELGPTLAQPGKLSNKSRTFFIRQFHLATLPHHRAALLLRQLRRTALLLRRLLLLLVAVDRQLQHFLHNTSCHLEIRSHFSPAALTHDSS